MINNDDLLISWAARESAINSTSDLLDWVKNLNESTHVKIKECSIYDSDFWFYDDYNGEILNRKRSFFSITGMRHFEDGEFIGEQPIIIQSEIGYLGIICKKFNGVIHFLMQAKIEPGNINCVQISPTLQATKSNFTRAHGGKFPAYLDYFENSAKYYVIYDQIQSEQSSRFFRKRNRNMIMYLTEDQEIEAGTNFKWMTLGQIKTFMKINNLVNMDSRTVLSGLPFYLGGGGSAYFKDSALYESIFLNDSQQEIPQIFQQLNNYKMFRDVILSRVPLNQLTDWKMDEYGIYCKKPANFSVHYYDIEISGREVQHWIQPLFKASGTATFGLIAKNFNGTKKFLVQIKPEIGTFDKIELAPSVQWEPTHSDALNNIVDKCLRNHLRTGEGVNIDVLLSEEGGRFYHEQNRNIIITIKQDELNNIPDGYLWVSLGTLNYLIQISNCLNIQLRNLLALIDL